MKTYKCETLFDKNKESVLFTDKKLIEALNLFIATAALEINLKDEEMLLVYMHEFKSNQKMNDFYTPLFEIHKDKRKRGKQKKITENQNKAISILKDTGHLRTKKGLELEKILNDFINNTDEYFILEKPKSTKSTKNIRDIFLKYTEDKKEISDFFLYLNEACH